MALARLPPLRPRPCLSPCPLPLSRRLKLRRHSSPSPRQRLPLTIRRRWNRPLRRIRLRPSRFQRGSRGPRMFSHSLFRGRRSSRMQRCREFPPVRRRLHRGQLPLRAPCPVPRRGQQMLRPALLRQKLPPRPICSTSSRRRSALRARRWGSRLPCSPLSRYSAWRGTSSTRRSSQRARKKSSPRILRNI